MSKKEKANLSKIQTGLNSVSKLVLSSTSSTMERTEDDVGDEMDISLECDLCKKLIGGLKKLELLECGHFYCVNCTPQQLKEKHTSCFTATSPSSAFTRELSPKQIAEHDGELSQDGVGAERSNIRGSGRQSKKIQVPKSKSGRKRKIRKKPDQQLWSFLYLAKPIVVNLPKNATYGDLLNTLHLLLGVDKKTHEIHIRNHKSSSEEAEGELSTPGEPNPVEVIDSKSRLRDLRIPRQKMAVLEVEEKKKGSAEDKSEPKKNEKEKRGIHEEMPSLSQSRAEEPKSL
ncbi:hypothetical protein L3Y34_001547 [Caenorhabditis briggsae]|uniref:Uncharacterized protein n=1 Tax=Caenorhabditis briggsae TaxID=6238 RepID=A0AAE9DCG4_CAEBR|nr:hypothetical protein L3Y34_001547 [Caenorhabditis briggsae]